MFTIQLSVRNIVAAVACCGWSAASADTIQSTADFEGVWQGTQNNAQFSLELSATASGAFIRVKKITRRCRYVVEPQGENGQFVAILTDGAEAKCGSGAINIEVDGTNMQATLPAVWSDKAYPLRQGEGPATAERSYPSVAVRGIKLGMTLDDAKQQLSKTMSVRNKGSSRRVVQGTKQINGTYLQASMPYGGELAQLNASQDNVAVYAIKDDANVGAMAVTRLTAPSPQDAPTVDRFLAALNEAYGKPQKVDRSASSHFLTWYFGEDGNLASGAALNACAQRVGSKTPTRTVAMLFKVLEFSRSTGRAKVDGSSVSRKLHPQAGCGYTLFYQLSSREGGLLETAQSYFYDHRAVASSIWTETSGKLDEQIKRMVDNVASAKSNAPEL